MPSQNEDTKAELNDVAVSLLEQNCYLQAFETFKEALTDGSNMDAANARLESPEPFPKPPPLKYSVILMQELTTLEKNIDFVFDKLQDDACQDCFLPVRFGDLLAPVDIESAIIEYNYGIAHQAYAIALLKKKKRVISNNHCQVAIHLLRSSDLALEKISATCGTKNMKHTDGSQTLFVRLALLLSLHKLVVGTEDEDEVREKLIDVHARISTMFETLEMAHKTVARMHATNRRGSIDDSQNIEMARMA